MASAGEFLKQALEFHNGGHLEQAATLYRQILQSDPAHPDAHHLLGVLEHQRGRSELAIPLIRQAIALDSFIPAFYSNLGIVLRAQGHTAEAIACYRRAVELRPQFADAHFNLGNALEEQGKFDEAIACFNAAVDLNPKFADAFCNMGVAHKAQGRLAEAAACYRQAATINPSHINALINLGLAYKDQGQLAEAQDCFEQALRLQPDHPAGRWHLAQLKLLQGDFSGGWADFEYRLQVWRTTPKHADRPRWDGLSLNGKTILLHAEAGLGNTLQFIRYAPLIKRGGGTVLFECQPALLQFLEGVAGVDKLIAAGSPLPHFDVQAPLLSVPGLLHTTRTTIPAKIPYLRADPKLVSSWRRTLEPLEGLRIGIAWQGDPSFPDDLFRSIPLRHFEALANVPGVGLISLQKGPGTEQIRSLIHRFSLLDLSDRLDRMSAFTDTAAVMMNLRLVVTSDTSIAHLAGALGVHVWTILPLVPDWRWRLHQAASRWYPTMRLFRQTVQGNWGTVFERVAAEIQKL